MKKIKLATSPVVFNEEEHTYTLGGQTLSGITSIIQKYIFPDMYAGVSDGILKSAAERGHRIHEELQMQFLGMPLSEPSIEVVAYNQLAKQNKLKQIAADIETVAMQSGSHIWSRMSYALNPANMLSKRIKITQRSCGSRKFSHKTRFRFKVSTT